jgi:hypothetical protein
MGTPADAEECEGAGGVTGVVAQGGGDVASAVEAQDRDGEVAQASHGPRGGAGADLGGVLGKSDIADVVQRLDAPVPSDPVGQAGGAGLGGGEAGDRVDGHHAPAAAVQGPDLAGDANRLGFRNRVKGHSGTSGEVMGRVSWVVR